MIPSYDTFRQFLADFSTAKDKMGEDARARRRTALLAYDRALMHSDFHDTIRTLYDNTPLLDEGGYRYAAAFYPSASNQVDNVDSILVSRLAAHPDYHVERDWQYRQAVVDSSKGTMWNGSKYIAHDLNTAGELKVQCYLDKYFGVLETCDALKFEAQYMWCKHRSSLEANPWQMLVARKQVHDHVNGDPIHNCASRIAGIGVSTLICFSRTQGSTKRYHGILRRRSTDALVIDRGTFHVIPAAMFEPSDTDFEEPFSIYENVLREYLEELFSIVAPKDNMDPFWYRYHPRVQQLQRYIERGDAELLLVGLAVNLMNLRPEVCTLLLIHTDEWGREVLRQTTVNPEYDRVSMDNPRGFMPPTDHLEDLHSHAGLSPTNMVVPAAAAFWKGMQLAQKRSRKVT